MIDLQESDEVVRTKPIRRPAGKPRRIFICWSGERSRSVALYLQDWLVKVLRLTDEQRPFLSSDIEKGSRWMEVVRNELTQADAALVCLTPENLRSTWIHFEVGALAGAIREEKSVFTFLYRVQPGELPAPLNMFQYTEFTDTDTLRMIEALNKFYGSKLNGETLRKNFEEYWNDLKDKLSNIEQVTITKHIPDLFDIFDRKTFNEPLDECTAQSWLDRFKGAVETLQLLERHRSRIKEHGQPVQTELFGELVREVDGYIMEMSALLLRQRRWPQREDGRIDIPARIVVCCEGRRRTIKQLVTDLCDADSAPVFPSAVRFSGVRGLSGKKMLFIHPLEAKIRRGTWTMSPEERLRCEWSRWDFDRIALYLHDEGKAEPDCGERVERTYREFEKVRSAGDAGISLVALHYALRSALAHAGKHAPSIADTEDGQRKLEEIKTYLDSKRELDEGGEVKGNLVRLIELLKKSRKAGSE